MLTVCSEAINLLGRRSKKLNDAAYLFTKIDSGKDSAFKKLNEGVCSRCDNGVTLDSGIKLKGTKGTRAYLLTELRTIYSKFETDRLAKARLAIGREDVGSFDEFMVFVLKRTDVCPHKLLDPEAMYWLETINMFDGEMGLTLPYQVDKIPALFFDALTLVRKARHKAKEEDKDKK